MKEVVKKLEKLRGGKVLLGLSGGVDSRVLFELLREAKVDFFCVHVNHNLRENAKRDADFCLDLCEKNGVECKVVSVKVLEIAAENGWSLEQAGRQARREIFASFEAEIILLAHHADDQVETILLNLLRGATVHGMVGMREENGKFLRPLLEKSKAEILAYDKEKKLEHVEDETNDCTQFVRNFLRLKFIPECEKKDKDFKKNLLEISARAEKISERRRKKAQEFLAKNEGKFLRKDFLGNSKMRQGEILRELWVQIHGSAIGFSAQRAKEVREMILKNVGGKKVQFGKVWVGISKGEVQWNEA